MVNGERVNTNSLAGLCHGCGQTYGDPVVHVILNCGRNQDHRGRFWDWTLDNMPLVFYSYLVQMDEHDLLEVLFGRTIC